MTTAHEPRRGPGTHLSVDDLSALAEGAQPSAQGAAEHLLECAACRGEVDAMSELLARFEEWDTPAMPQDVAIRIDAALARESAARAATAGHPAATAASARETSASSANTLPESTLPGSTESGNKRPGTTASGDAARSRRRRWRPAPGLSWVVAALVLIAGSVGLIIKLGVSAGESSATSASGSAAMHPYAATRSPEGFGAEAGPENGLASTVRAANSPLGLWVGQALSSQRPEALIDSPCLADPAFKGNHELTIAGGTYNGSAATLVVYAAPESSSIVLAVVYATPCTTTSFHVLDKAYVAKPVVGSTP